MITELLSDRAWIEHPVIVALLRYFAEIAESLLPPRHYLVVNPEFTALVIREMTVQQTELPDGATYGRREGSDYVLMPIHLPDHWTIAIGSPRTGVFEFFNPLQSGDAVSGVSPSIAASVVAVVDALNAGGMQVSSKQNVCSDASVCLRYPYSYDPEERVG